MSHSLASHPCLAALRPWPFGPPLRGRAPRGEAGVRAAHRHASLARLPSANGPCSGGQATAPVGSLAWIHPIYSA
jgi:hypothetical protein